MLVFFKGKQRIVKIDDYSPNVADDFVAAGKKAGFSDDAIKQLDDMGYVWHHHEDMETMILVPKELHNNLSHTGGRAVYKAIQDAKPSLLGATADILVASPMFLAELVAPNTLDKGASPGNAARDGMELIGAGYVVRIEEVVTEISDATTPDMHKRLEHNRNMNRELRREMGIEPDKGNWFLNLFK